MPGPSGRAIFSHTASTGRKSGDARDRALAPPAVHERHRGARSRFPRREGAASARPPGGFVPLNQCLGSSAIRARIRAGSSKTFWIAHLLSGPNKRWRRSLGRGLSRANQSFESGSRCLTSTALTAGSRCTAPAPALAPSAARAARLRLTTRRAACSSFDPRRARVTHLAGTASSAARL